MTTYPWLIQNTLRWCRCHQRGAATHFTYDYMKTIRYIVAAARRWQRHLQISYSYANHACRNLAASSPSKNIQMFFFKAVQFIHHVSDRPSRVATWISWHLNSYITLTQGGGLARWRREARATHDLSLVAIRRLKLMPAGSGRGPPVLSACAWAWPEPEPGLSPSLCLCLSDWLRQCCTRHTAAADTTLRRWLLNTSISLIKMIYSVIRLTIKQKWIATIQIDMSPESRMFICTQGEMFHSVL